MAADLDPVTPGVQVAVAGGEAQFVVRADTCAALGGAKCTASGARRERCSDRRLPDLEGTAKGCCRVAPLSGAEKGYSHDAFKGRSQVHVPVGAVVSP